MIQREVAIAKEVSNKLKRELGFVNRAALEKSFLVNELDVIGDGVGFVNFHHRKDDQTTIYELGVKPEFQRQGWGRLLFYRVLCSSIEKGKIKIVAKCPIDLPSNRFYERLGFQLKKLEPGRKRPLHVWEYKINLPLLFYCADGGRNEYGRQAKEAGWRLGFQSQQACPKSHVQMIDNEYRNYNHSRHVEMVKRHKPLLATVQDVMKEDDIPRILEEAKELSQYVGRILIIPKIKFNVPSQYWLAFSVPSSHGGTKIEPNWFGDRPTHLLGGSPTMQYRFSQLMNVVSLDGNYANRLSGWGKSVWIGNDSGQKIVKGCYDSFRLSMEKQKEQWHKESIYDTPLLSLLNPNTEKFSY